MVTLAAKELRTYLKKITGAELPIVNAPDDKQPIKIYVGRSAQTDKLGVTDDDLKYGAYRMVSGKDYLILLGQDADFDPILIVGSAEKEGVLQPIVKDKYLTEYWGLRPEVPLILYIRKDVWAEFMKTRQ